MTRLYLAVGPVYNFIIFVQLSVLLPVNQLWSW